MKAIHAMASPENPMMKRKPTSPGNMKKAAESPAWVGTKPGTPHALPGTASNAPCPAIPTTMEDSSQQNHQTRRKSCGFFWHYIHLEILTEILNQSFRPA